jgi:hypothetical protein
MDGYTLSAAFPLARPLDTARAFATAPLPTATQSSSDPRGTPSPTASPTATPSAPGGDERRTHALQIWRREGILSRVAAAFNGYNRARASVAAVVDAHTGQTRLFALDESDAILSIYRRALPELWSPASALPAFAREALRPPPHLAALQASAWASLLAPTPEAGRGKDWAVRDLFFLPSRHGLQTLVRLARTGKTGSSTSAPSTWGPRNAPAAVALASQPVSSSSQTWQARFLSQPPVEAQPLAPLEAGPSPARWAQRSSAIQEQAPSSTWKLLPARSRLQKTRELFRESQKAREQGDWSRFEDLTRQLEALLDQTP